MIISEYDLKRDVNFTWNVTYYQKNILKIQLNFTNPEVISANQVSVLC